MFSNNPNRSVDSFMERLRKRAPHEPEFHQAVHEVAEVIIPFINDNKKYQGYNLMERLSEPDRALSFRVSWLDDEGKIHVNRGYRVQFNNAIGPYKGGIRFHETVNLSILKFLGYEQVFKNSLTTLPMGGGKGGANFNPKGRSELEVMRFCQAFMMELSRLVGPNTDVPAGDIGVGGREVGYMFGAYKKLRNEHSGVLTGKGMSFGGSLLRPEATGYGCVYFMQNMLKHIAKDMQGMTCIVSGSGNVAQYTTEKILELGGKVVAMSDSSGTVYDKDGIDAEKLAWIMELKNERRGRIEEYANEYGAEYRDGKRPWDIPCDLAFPCATQNELDKQDAEHLAKNGCKGVAEGANMPVTTAGIEVLHEAGIMYAPGKASNAGGVATSGLEMAQNSQHGSWTRNMVDEKLRDIMADIHEKCVQYGSEGGGGHVNYVKGANIAGFVKVADAMIAQGVM